jgi:hypothetical protein
VYRIPLASPSIFPLSVCKKDAQVTRYWHKRIFTVVDL